LLTIFAFLNDPSQTVATARIAPKICQGQPPHLAYTVPDFIQISSLSAELLPNAWRPFLPRIYNEMHTRTVLIRKIAGYQISESKRLTDLMLYWERLKCRTTNTGPKRSRPNVRTGKYRKRKRRTVNAVPKIKDHGYYGRKVCCVLCKRLFSDGPKINFYGFQHELLYSSLSVWWSVACDGHTNRCATVLYLCVFITFDAITVAPIRYPQYAHFRISTIGHD